MPVFTTFIPIMIYPSFPARVGSLSWKACGPTAFGCPKEGVDYMFQRFRSQSGEEGLLMLPCPSIGQARDILLCLSYCAK